MNVDVGGLKVTGDGLRVSLIRDKTHFGWTDAFRWRFFSQSYKK
jgi:hypothetical protein